MDIKVAELVERLKEKRITLTITDAAKKHLGDAGFSEKYGARPLRRVIQNEVETKVGKLIVAGDVMEGANLVVDVDERGIVVRVDE